MVGARYRLKSPNKHRDDNEIAIDKIGDDGLVWVTALGKGKKKYLRASKILLENYKKL
ncbi:MAG: hypothetical protein AAB660_02205 [Patescibacteria group bacterium]